MKIFPAIDILNGRAVRLLYGKIDNVTDYGDPVERALLWKSCGADYLHIVDLNGAFEGKRVNDNIIKNIIKETGIKAQCGGGIRTLDDIKKRFDLGLDRVILGTTAYKNIEVLREAVKLYGDKIAVGIDAENGKLRLSGWTESTDVNFREFILKMKDEGIKTVIYTDIGRDGALSGVNITETVGISVKTGLNIIASGGVNSINDIIFLNVNGIYGAILGKWIYSDENNLRKAYEVLKK